MSDHRPLTFLIPEGGGIIESLDDISAVGMAIVERHDAGSLGSEWDVSGVYILLGREGSGWRAYVGKAPAGLRQRITAHNKAKGFWSRALLVRRDTVNGFSSAHASWLEGRLYELLGTFAEVKLENKQVPGDKTLASHDSYMLEQAVVPPVSSILRIMGLAPKAAYIEKPLRASTFHGVTVKDLLGAGFVSVGEELTFTHEDYPASAVILDSGEIHFSGKSYPTLSAAGVAVRDKETNGWYWWGASRDSKIVKMQAIREEYLERGNS